MSGSMTGWGMYKTNDMNISIRGLNSKYKEIYLHLPQELFEIEPLVYKIANERISRGRVDIFINLNLGKLRKKYLLNDFLFQNVYEEIKNLFNKLGIKRDVPLEYILRDVEGVASTVMPWRDGKMSEKKIRKIVELAFNDFEKSKKIEGIRLLNNIKKHIARIAILVQKLEKGFLYLRKSYIEKTKNKIRDLFEKDRDKKMFDLNIVEILEKYDITEELVRMNSHIKQLRLMTDGNSSGRKIDFFAQEIYREANTINSKIQEHDIIVLAIEIKEMAEKIREQAQNLE